MLGGVGRGNFKNLPPKNARYFYSYCIYTSVVLLQLGMF